MNDSYAEKLLHPLWQKKKAAILERDNHTCRSCGSQDITLHAHHIFYVPDTDPWDYKDDALITYCEVCHNTQHLIGNTLQECLLEIIKENPLHVHLVGQLCILTEEVPEFTDKLRKFLKKEMEGYYELKRKTKGNG